jgi:hypothetical protein
VYGVDGRSATIKFKAKQERPNRWSSQDWNQVISRTRSATTTTSTFGYLRIVVDTQQLRIEFHPERDGVTTKTPDVVTVSLAHVTRVHYSAPRTPLNNQV